MLAEISKWFVMFWEECFLSCLKYNFIIYQGCLLFFFESDSMQDFQKPLDIILILSRRFLGSITLLTSELKVESLAKFQYRDNDVT